MDTTEVLIKVMDSTENEEVKRACLEAIHALAEVPMLRKRINRSVQVPCRLGQKIYSVIGEGVQEHVIDGYRIDKDGVYMNADGYFMQTRNIGKYYFLSEAVAKKEFERMHKRDRTG